MASRAALAALTLALAVLAGCSSPSSEPHEAGEGSASVYVKDAPTDEFDEIHVVFTRVQVHASGSGGEDDDGEASATTTTTAAGNGTADGNQTADGNATDDGARAEAGWITLFEDSAGVDVDLLNASGTRAAFLGEADLEAGHYTQLRVTVEEAYGMQNGTRVPITVSSGTLKLTHPFEVEADAETRIVLDFDLDGSLHQQGNGNWRMTPVVGTVQVDEVEDAESGTEAGDSEGEVGEL